MAQFEYQLPFAFTHHATQSYPPYASSSTSFSFPPTTPPGLVYDLAAVHDDFAEMNVDGHPHTNAYASSSSAHIDVHAPQAYYNEGYTLGQPFYQEAKQEEMPYEPLVKREEGEDEGEEPPMTSALPKEKDMNMASTGSEAAMAGIHTPLANYIAHMVCYMWYDTPDPSKRNRNPTSPVISNPFATSPPLNTVNPLQVAPTREFSAFVETLLRVTMVSHSVTLLALLYLHRLKARNNITPVLGTEQRPFIASLILGNKYLDDNTYTNKTWAELTNLATSDINRMEHEFLQGLDFNLKVDKGEYESWRRMLDGYIYSLERTAQHPVPNAGLALAHSDSPGAVISAFPPMPSARSQSESPPHNRSTPFYRGSYNTPPHEHGRKRSAENAFAADIVTPASIHESLRQPSGRYQLHIPPPNKVINGPRMAVQTPSESSLGRSSSLTRSSRQIARYPGRRGSLGGNQHFVPSQDDLRHTATQHAAMAAQGYGMEAQPWQYGAQAEYNALIRPYNVPPPHAIPPENMEFYTVSARAHPGQDGALRKGILRHQAAEPYYTPATQAYAAADPSMLVSGQQTPFYQPSPADIDLMTPASVMSAYTTPMNALPAVGFGSIPGNFANGGLPGYMYEPQSQGQFHYNGYPAQHAYVQQSENVDQLQRQQGHQASQQHYQPRSQWSSPLPPQFHLFRQA